MHLLQQINYLLLWALLTAQSHILYAQIATNLSATGLYSDIVTFKLAPGVKEYDVQYPLWSDGELKRRWILLPVGSKINTKSGNWWKFPIGTKLWKEFAYNRNGKIKRIETRLIHHSTRGWEFMTYLWNEQDTEATISNGQMYQNYVHLGEGVYHHVPGVDQCFVCHRKNDDISPVIGFSALQLAHEKEGLKLRDLIKEGLLTHVLPEDISIKSNSVEGSQALGLMHGNCAHCHNPKGIEAGLGMDLKHDIFNKEPEYENAFKTTVNKESRYSYPDAEVSFKRILPGQAEQSVLYRRVKASSHQDPFYSEKMPPGVLGTMTQNTELLKNLKIWINSLKTRKDLSY